MSPEERIAHLEAQVSNFQKAIDSHTDLIFEMKLDLMIQIQKIQLADSLEKDVIHMLIRDMQELRNTVSGKQVIDGSNLELRAMQDKLEDLAVMIEGRNKSAATKRNMTDEDARAVLSGAYKNVDHKAAAEKIHLTYAQIYSCRCEFTFKHVHKELAQEGFVNPWSKAGIHRIK